MAEMIREPIGLRVLIRALRPDDREAFLMWRADPWDETEALVEAGEAADRAALWAGLLRWREAEVVTSLLTAEGWEVSLRGVRAVGLAHAVEQLRPPSDQGWLLSVDGLRLRVVAEAPAADDQALERLLAFLDQ